MTKDELREKRDQIIKSFSIKIAAAILSKNEMSGAFPKQEVYLSGGDMITITQNAQNDAGIDIRMEYDYSYCLYKWKISDY